VTDDECSSDLDSSGERLVRLGQLVVGTVQVLVLDLQFSEVCLVLLLGTAELRLVLGLDVNDCPLQLLGTPQTALPVQQPVARHTSSDVKRGQNLEAEVEAKNNYEKSTK